MNGVRSSVYAQKVELLLRLIPIVMEEDVFAIHGGTAINLFLKDLPRYSVDIDLTYIPLADRQTSLDDINMHLNVIAEKAKKAFKGMHIVPNFSTCKLLCEYRGRQVKIEVNQTKRGIIGGDVQTIPLSEKAQEEFSLFCEANVVPTTQLYGGKIAAALSRQHPRDLFDVKYMDIPLSECREGLIFCLLGSDRPIHESFTPRLIDQREAMENQFSGMTDIPFSYEEFEATRAKLINDVKSLMTEADKKFLISFESGQPEWDGYEFEYFKDYPSVQWKLLNLKKLGKQNPQKLQEEAEKLRNLFNFNLNN
ncbi:MAG: nucleotidyl transferase AbiEii/AbiGii toxin family protein [Bacteroidales bacterium]|nr:nucleotidyl transferase AbiEii/AbiGii toxin family protein [Bacteroidales bacterium]